MDISNLTTSNLDQHLQSFIESAKLDILRTQCGLNHGIPYEENPVAVDYLCQGFGDQRVGNIDSIIQIPACAECIASLFSEFQILLLCLNCISSKWIFRPDSKLEFPEDKSLFLLTQCPNCYTEEREVNVYAT